MRIILRCGEFVGWVVVMSMALHVAFVLFTRVLPLVVGYGLRGLLWLMTRGSRQRCPVMLLLVGRRTRMNASTRSGAISHDEIEQGRKMTRVKVCTAFTPDLLEADVNRTLEALEAEGYGVISIAYGDRVPYTVLITYGRGQTIMQRWGGRA